LLRPTALDLRFRCSPHSHSRPDPSLRHDFDGQTVEMGKLNPQSLSDMPEGSSLPVFGSLWGSLEPVVFPSLVAVRYPPCHPHALVTRSCDLLVGPNQREDSNNTRPLRPIFSVSYQCVNQCQANEVSPNTLFTIGNVDFSFCWSQRIRMAGGKKIQLLLLTPHSSQHCVWAREPGPMANFCSKRLSKMRLWRGIHAVSNCPKAAQNCESCHDSPVQHYSAAGLCIA
jgi:hypothetical protein